MQTKLAAKILELIISDLMILLGKWFVTHSTT